jgi:hypothetical protein
MPPQKLVTDIRSVSGKWEGRNEFGNPLLMTMKEDGTFSVMITVPGGSQVERKGRARLENGELVYDAELSSGKLTLHEGDNRRVLVMHGTYKPIAATAAGVSGNFTSESREVK